MVLICGDREWGDEDRMWRKMLQVGFPDKVAFLVHGGAKGADSMSEKLALEMGFPKERILKFDADWTRYGKAAGAIRNRKQYRETKPDLTLAFHDHPERSRGTVDMVSVAKRGGAETWCSWEDPDYGSAGVSASVGPGGRD